MPVLPSISAVPGAVAQFMAIASAALPGSTVWFGKELSVYTTPVTLQVLEVTGDQAPAELGTGYRREEKFALACTLSYYQGGPPDFLACMTAAMNAFAAVGLAVGNNPSLNDAVRFAQVGNYILTTDTDGGGKSSATLDFAVRCEARVTSLT